MDEVWFSPFFIRKNNRCYKIPEKNILHSVVNMHCQQKKSSSSNLKYYFQTGKIKIIIRSTTAKCNMKMLMEGNWCQKQKGKISHPRLNYFMICIGRLLQDFPHNSRFKKSGHVKWIAYENSTFGYFAKVSVRISIKQNLQG